MPDLSNCSLDDMQKYMQTHADLKAGIVGKLQGLTCGQMRKLTDRIDEWIVKITSEKV